MAQDATRKSHPLALRIPAADLAVIDRAAKMTRRSRTDFMRDAAVREAEEIILESTLVKLSEAGFKSFVEAIEAPPKVNEKLLRALQKATETEKA
jgi:uncharacterized protein (DUF1778 family)